MDTATLIQLPTGGAPAAIPAWTPGLAGPPGPDAHPSIRVEGDRVVIEWILRTTVSRCGGLWTKSRSSLLIVSTGLRSNPVTQSS